VVGLVAILNQLLKEILMKIRECHRCIYAYHNDEGDLEFNGCPYIGKMCFNDEECPSFEEDEEF
jgi:hypothetical protein